jgi:LysR family glycine cleavage system transcriptional activator
MSNGIRRLPALNALRAFEVAARHLNFRLAAEELGVTQGAVAQHVRALEAQLGLQLFDRNPRSLSLTPAGRGYVGHIRRAFEIISDATARLRPEPRHLTISVTPTFATRWLLPRLPAFLPRRIQTSTCVSTPANGCRTFKAMALIWPSGWAARPLAPDWWRTCFSIR